MLLLECMHTQKPKAVNLSIIIDVWTKFVLNFLIFIGVFVVMFQQTFAVILTGRVKLNVCVVFKSFCRDTCGPP